MVHIRQYRSRIDEGGEKMRTVIYLANQQIQVVTGQSNQKKITVFNSYVEDAPEGSIINGILMDTEVFAEFIKNFWTEHKLPTKDVTLVVNSTKFVGQTIELPSLKDSKTLEYIDREFADIRKEENVVYGYIPLANSDAKIRKIYAESISTDFIQEYIDMFRSAGISLKAIHSGESSLIGLTEMTVASRFDTFVMLIADNMTLTTLLWVNKGFYYFNSVRCFHEQGTEDYAVDVARSVSQIIQFMKANQVEYELESIQLSGIVRGNMELYQTALEQQGITVGVEVFNSSLISSDVEDLQNALHATSGLITDGKHQNFLSQYSGKKKQLGIGNKIKKEWIVVGVVALVMILLTAVSISVRVMKQKQLAKWEEEVNDSMSQMLLMDYDRLSTRNNFLNRQYEAIDEINENINSYPVCDDAILRTIQKCAGSLAKVEFESFDAEAGIVRVVAKSEDVDTINVFIKELLGQDIFNNVDYTGYSLDDETGFWDIHVVCTLTESAGRD